MATIDLCTVADVKASLLVPASTSRDALIADLVTDASRRIMRHAGREFVSEAPAGTARTFAYRGGRHVSLAPYDLRADEAYTITLDGSDLVEDSDFYLDPLPATEGVYERVVLFNLYPAPYGRPTLTMGALGRSKLVVTGSWGFPSVPEEVRRAAVLTVISWLDRAAPSDFTPAGDDSRTIAPSASGGYDLPLAAKRMLAPFRRLGVK